MAMSRLMLAVLLATALPAQEVAMAQGQEQVPHNPAIDADAFLKNAQEAIAHRVTHLISEDEFLRMMQEPGTIVLDARSREKFDLLHIDGAINLSFPDITVDDLAAALPDKNTRILIYCNNNFRNEERAFPTKKISAPLNLPTFSTLYDYGYRNVYELGENVDAHATRLPLVATANR